MKRSQRNSTEIMWNTRNLIHSNEITWHQTNLKNNIGGNQMPVEQIKDHQFVSIRGRLGCLDAYQIWCVRKPLWPSGPSGALWLAWDVRRRVRRHSSGSALALGFFDFLWFSLSANDLPRFPVISYAVRWCPLCSYVLLGFHMIAFGFNRFQLI